MSINVYNMKFSKDSGNIFVNLKERHNTLLKTT